MSFTQVSIIIPTRNRAQLLLQSLRSAVEQSWSKIEIIVVDDGSTDTTQTEVARLYPQVKFLRHETAKGPSAARNTGIAMSRSSYVLFLDDDDLLHPQHVRDLVKASISLPEGAAVSGQWRRFEETAESMWFGPIMCCPEERDDVMALEELLEPLGEGSIWTSSILWPRSLFERVQWDETLYTNGDVDFFGRAVLSGCRIYGRQVGRAYYRTHSGERVAGTLTTQSLISSTRYRLKWTELLDAHPQRNRFASAMQNALMSLLIAWSQRSDGMEWLQKLKAAYRKWGGTSYYLPLPPRNTLKRIAATVALKVGGPAAVGALFNLKNKRVSLQPTTKAAFPLDPADAEDARVIASIT